MKTKQIISAALMLLLSVTAFSGCGTKESKTQDVTAVGTSVVLSETQENEEIKSAETGENTPVESVKTYFVYAEQGAVITWFDSETGQFRYKQKCEYCGRITGSEYSDEFVIISGSGSFSNNAPGFYCSNSDCVMHGKSQDSVIGCTVIEKSVEADD